MKNFRIVLLFFLIILLTSCSSLRTISETNDYNSDLKDGVFKAQSLYYNSNGFKPQLEITVKKGIISEVKYKELNKSGVDRIDTSDSVLKWDNCDFSYNQILPKLYNNTIIYQGSQIDTISGATQTVNNYSILQDIAINSCKLGDTSVKEVNKFTDTYTVTNEVDPITGSQEVLTVQFIEGKVNQVVVREVTNNAAFYAIGRAYSSLAAISQANKSLEGIVSANVDLNILDRYNALINELNEERSGLN